MNRLNAVTSLALKSLIVSSIAAGVLSGCGTNAELKYSGLDSQASIVTSRNPEATSDNNPPSMNPYIPSSGAPSTNTTGGATSPVAPLDKPVTLSDADKSAMFLNQLCEPVRTYQSLSSSSSIDAYYDVSMRIAQMAVVDFLKCSSLTMIPSSDVAIAHQYPHQSISKVFQANAQSFSYCFVRFVETQDSILKAGFEYGVHTHDVKEYASETLNQRELRLPVNAQAAQDNGSLNATSLVCYRMASADAYKRPLTMGELAEALGDQWSIREWSY